MSIFDLAHQDEVQIPISMVDGSHTSIVLVTILGTFSWLIVGCRIYTRIFLIRSFGWDDATMIVALVCLSSTTIESSN
jgi:hypothetical protein